MQQLIFLQSVNLTTKAGALFCILAPLILIGCQIEPSAPAEQNVSADPTTVAQPTATATEAALEPTIEPISEADSGVENTPTPDQTFAPVVQNEEQPAAQSWFYFSNPGGGGAFHTVGQGADGVVIVGSDLGGAYLNRNISNPASRWEIIGLDRGLTQTHVSAVGFSPADPNTVLLGTDWGIFRSTDSGMSFEKVHEDGYFHDFAFSPDGNSVYATYHPAWNSDQGQILKSTDGGQTWSIVSQNLPAGLRLLKLLNTQHGLFALSGEGRFAGGAAAVYQSSDRGETWDQVATALGDIMDIAIDEAGALWLTTYEVEPELYGQLFSSTDGGNTWTSIAQRHGVIWPSSEGPLRLVDPRFQFPWDERNGVWESVDNGVTWQQISTIENYDFGWSTAYFAHLDSFDGPVRTLAFNGDSAIWANSQFVFGSFDGGQNFQNLYTTQTGETEFASRGIDNIVFFDVAISQTDAQGNGAMYMAMYDMGCFRSLDGGTSWENCNVPELTGAWEGAGGNSFTVLAEPNPGRAGTVWMTMVGDIGEPVTLVRSDNFGAANSWQVSNSGLPETASTIDLAIDPNSPADMRVLFATVAGDVYRSIDDGWTWSQVFDCNGCRFVAVDPFDSDHVLAGGEAGLFRSQTGGQDGIWQMIGPAELGGPISGDYWEWDWKGVRDIEFDERVSGRIAVGVQGEGGGIYLTSDAGDSWNKVLDNRYIRDVHITPKSLMAASSSAWEAGGYDSAGQGVLRSTDNGATWQTANDGLPWPFPAKLVTLDEANETLLLAVQGPGLFVTDFAD